MIVIEKNIKAPLRRDSRGVPAKYPFREMLPGDSFELKDKGRGTAYTRTLLSNCARHFVIYNNLDWVFSAKQTESGAIIFRVK